MSSGTTLFIAAPPGSSNQMPCDPEARDCTPTATVTTTVTVPAADPGTVHVLDADGGTALIGLLIALLVIAAGLLGWVAVLVRKGKGEHS